MQSNSPTEIETTEPGLLDKVATLLAGATDAVQGFAADPIGDDIEEADKIAEDESMDDDEDDMDDDMDGDDETEEA